MNFFPGDSFLMKYLIFPEGWESGKPEWPAGLELPRRLLIRCLCVRESRSPLIRLTRGRDRRGHSCGRWIATVLLYGQDLEGRWCSRPEKAICLKCRCSRGPGRQTAKIRCGGGHHASCRSAPEGFHRRSCLSVVFSSHWPSSGRQESQALLRPERLRKAAAAPCGHLTSSGNRRSRRCHGQAPD